MCDCIPSASLSFSIIKVQQSRSTSPGNQRHYRPNFQTSSAGNRSLKFAASKPSRNPELYGDLGFKEKERHNQELETTIGGKGTDSRDLGVLGVKGKNRRGKEELVPVKEDSDAKIEGESRRVGRKGGKQVTRRSNLVAKQVISIQSALSLGFVSQIWVDIASWVVLVIEVRPNLLSGESERFLLEDVSQVGDVVLVEDENVLETELKMVGLETLVGYRVVTPGRRNIAKVRGYSFNIISGSVESLELDSFGISIIPSSLVSTYALPVEDVLEVLSDTVVVHEAAASNIQRLTKGLWDAQNVGSKMGDEVEEPVTSNHDPSPPRSFSRRQRFNPRITENEDDWQLPMDYL